MVFEGQPYVVMEFHFLRMQQRKPVVQTKIRNIITGKTVEKTFQPSDKFEEAEIETKPIKYLYSNNGRALVLRERQPERPIQVGRKRCAGFYRLIKNQFFD